MSSVNIPDSKDASISPGEKEGKVKHISPFDVGDDALDISAKGDGSLYKVVKVDGTGDSNPFYGCKVILQYSWKLPDDLEESRLPQQQSKRVEFVIGKGNVLMMVDMDSTSQFTYCHYCNFNISCMRLFKS